MCDVSEQAIEYAAMNMRMNNVPNIRIRLSDGYKNVGERDFTLILSNPPYHADFSVPKHFIEEAIKEKEKAANSLSKKLQRKQQRNKIKRKK